MESRLSAAPPAAFGHREILVILSGVMLGMILAGLDQTIVATALPTIARELHGIQHMSWVVSGYLLTSTAATPIYGKLSDLYGRKVMLQVAIGIFLVASTLCAIAGTMTELILARALRGIGGGGLMAMAHATIADVIAPRDRGRYQGYFSSVFAATSVAGPVLGGFFSDHLTWRWVFWINIPIGVVAILICNKTLRKLTVPRTARREIDYVGATLLVSAITLLVLATTWGGVEMAWSSPNLIGLVVASLVLLAAFVLRERIAREPIIPLRLFRIGIFTVASIGSFLSSMAMFGAIIFLPLFLQLVSGETASQSGFLLIPLTGAIVAGAYAAGRIVSHTGRYKIFPILGLAIATFAFVLLSTMDARTGRIESGCFMALVGLGIGMVLPIMVVTIQNAVDLRDLGTGTAAVNFFRSMGGSFGVALLGSVLLSELDRRIARVPGHETMGDRPAFDLLHGDTSNIGKLGESARRLLVMALEQSFTVVFLTGAAISAIALITVFFLKELPLRTAQPHGLPAPSASDDCA